MGINRKISVIMAVFNGEKYLQESIESILNQTYKDFEFIIVDDGSFDRTPEILKDWTKRDSRIKIIANEQNIGLTKSLNKAIKTAQGKYIARQDADDVSLLQRLEKQIEYLENHPEIKVLGTFSYAINKKGDILGKNTLPVSFSEIKKNLIKKNPFIHSSVMIEREALNKFGLYNEKFRTGQDHELWFRILKNVKGENLPLFLLKKRYLPDMISINKEKEQLKCLLFLRKEAIKRGDYSKICYIYLLRPYLSLKCPLFLKKFLRKYFLKSKKIFKELDRLESLPNARPVDRYLEFLACPYCKNDISLNQETKLRCLKCNKVFELRDNFPILLPDFLLKSVDWQKWGDFDNKHQKFYQNWSKKKHLASQFITKAFYDWVGLKDIQNVSLLDVGGGNGVARVIYWKYPEKINYFNIDPQINFLPPFYSELYPKIKEIDFPYIVGVGEYLPLKSNKFDVAITTASLDHCCNPNQVFKEIFRCLKPKGRLFIMISKHKNLTKKNLGARIFEYYQINGFFALIKEAIKRILSLFFLKKRLSSDSHIHHFRSLQDLTKLLYMFKIIRIKEAKEGNQFYLECLKE